MHANPRQHLQIGTPDRRCWQCAAYRDDSFPAAGSQPMGWCQLVRWLVPGAPVKNRKGPPTERMVEQMVHADDVCAKFEAAHGNSPVEAEEWALRMGLG